MTCGPETLPERFRALWMDADAVCAYIRRIGVNRVFSAQTFFRLAVQTDGGWLAYDHVLHGANAHDIPLSGIHIRFDDGDTFEAIVGQEPAEAQDVLQQLAVDIHSPWHPMAEIKDGLDHAFVHLASVDDVRVDSLLEDVGVPITRVMVRGAGEKDWNGVAALRFLSGQTAQDLQDRICAGGNDFLALPWNPASSETAGRIHIRTDSVMGVMVRGAYGAQDGTYIDNSVEMVVRYGHRRVLYYAYGNDFDAARMAARRVLGACPPLGCMGARKMV